MAQYPSEPTGPAGPRPPSAQSVLGWTLGGLMVVLLASLMLLAGILIGRDTKKATQAAAVTAPASVSDQFSTLGDIYQTLQQQYVEPAKLPDLATQKQGAIDGLLQAVGDAHQVYVPAQDVALENTDLSGQFEGIGATVEQKNGQVLIQSLIPDEPASKSNLKPGDVILAVDGASMVGKSSTDVVKVIRGQAGTKVTISVQHSDGTKEDVTITRAQITLDSVHTEDLKDKAGNPVTDLGYVRIDQFQDSTATELAKYLDGIKNKGYKGLILDLRNNPGGRLDICEQVLSDFLKSGQVELIQQERGGAQQVDKAASSSSTTALPLVVLVNKQSASASEITAGALQSNKRATVIGEQTFGKGTVNQFFPLPDGGELYVTVGRWLTPDNKQIEGQGITPDVVVHLDNGESAQSIDNAQLYAAIDYLHQHGS